MSIIIPLATERTQRRFTPAYLSWFSWWVTKLGLRRCNFGILVLKRLPGETRRLRVNAQVNQVSKKKKLYLIILSDRTAGNSKLAKIAMVHELIHVMFFEAESVGRIKQEELIVSKISPLIARIADLARELSVRELSRLRRH